MLHYETIEPGTLQLLKELQALPFLQDCRLVGGTALALQLGHRKSIDLDFFGKIPASSEEIRLALSANHRVTVVKESRSINIYLVDNIKVDCVDYPYMWIDESLSEDGITLAQVKDIAAMKISAIIGRGSKKDFIDLYFLLRLFSLQEILGFYAQKYEDGSQFIAMKSLTYFKDADSDAMPLVFQKIQWDSVKEAICEAVSSL